MELRHLRYFVAVAEEENVSRAALKLHLSQPALSRQIRDLEEELGFPLLERTAKSVKLSRAGRVFLVEARAALKRVDEGIKAARAAAGASTAELHLGYAPTLTARILPPALRLFATAHPNVRVKLHDLSTGEMLECLRRERIQLALMVRPTRAMLRGIHFKELARDELRLAVPPRHPLAKLRSVTLARAAAEPFVIFSRRDYPEYFQILAGIFEQGKSRIKVAEEHESATSLITAIEAGCGVALTPESFGCTAGPRLKLLPLSPAPEALTIGLAWFGKEPGRVEQDFIHAAEETGKSLLSAETEMQKRRSGKEPRGAPRNQTNRA